jgi:multidrug efflux system outer membrane protein
LTEQEHPPVVPAGLPSSLLERRPDVRQAEDELVSANAHIGVARAAYFPQISLTARDGFQSSALTSLFTGPAVLWNFGGNLHSRSSPGCRLRSNVRLSEARQQEFLLGYEQTIQGAFRDVSDSLVAYLGCARRRISVNPELHDTKTRSDRLNLDSEAKILRWMLQLLSIS